MKGKNEQRGNQVEIILMTVLIMIADFIFIEMSCNGENNVFIGSEYLVGTDKTVNRQTT